MDALEALVEAVRLEEGGAAVAAAVADGGGGGFRVQGSGFGKGVYGCVGV